MKKKEEKKLAKLFNDQKVQVTEMQDCCKLFVLYFKA